MLNKLNEPLSNSIKIATPMSCQKYTTTFPSIDAAFIIEVGFYETKDDQDILKGKGKYLVVWKQENDDWKIYRDIGL
jgi:hypothetical protein